MYGISSSSRRTPSRMSCWRISFHAVVSAAVREDFTMSTPSICQPAVLSRRNVADAGRFHGPHRVSSETPARKTYLFGQQTGRRETSLPVRNNLPLLSFGLISLARRETLMPTVCVPASLKLPEPARRHRGALFSGRKTYLRPAYVRFCVKGCETCACAGSARRSPGPFFRRRL